MNRDTRRHMGWGWLLLMSAWMLGCGNLLGVVQSAQEAKGTVEALVTQVPATAEALATVAATSLPAVTDAAPSPAATSAVARADWGRPDDSPAVQTYRARWEYTFTLTDTGQTITLVQAEWAVDKSRSAEHVKFVSPTDSIEFIRVGSQLWLYHDQVGWVIADAQAQTATPFDTWALWENVVALDEGGWQPVGPETLDGLTTMHYRLIVPQGWWAEDVPAWLQGWGLMADYTLEAAGDGQLDAWVTPENWLARIEAQWPLTATDNAGSAHPAALRWLYAVWDVNAPLDIQPPQDVRADAPPLPLPPGAQVQSAVPGQGLWMFLVPDMDLAGIQAFYREQAQAGALTLEGEMGGPDMGFWQATAVRPDGARYRIMASHDEGGVALMIQKP